MTDVSDDSGRTIRDTFRIWNLNTVEQEVVLRRSDDQYVAIPLPEDEAALIERLADSSGTIDATLVKNEGKGASWRLDAIHGVEETT